MFHDFHNNTSEHPAVITKIWTNTCVNMTIFPDCNSPDNKTSIIQDEELKQLKGWRWPPRVK